MRPTEMIHKLVHLSAIAGMLLILSCGKKISISDKAFKEYTTAGLRSECVYLSESSRWRLGNQTLGASFIEFHNAQDSNDRNYSRDPELENKEGSENAPLSERASLHGEISRVLYHDPNCKEPAASFIMVDVAPFTDLKETSAGFEFQIYNRQRIIFHDEKSCEFVSNGLRWAECKDYLGQCTPGRIYDIDNLVGLHRAPGTEVQGGLKLFWDITYVEGSSQNANDGRGGLVVRGPVGFFQLATDRFAPHHLGELGGKSYRLFPQSTRTHRMSDYKKDTP